MILSSAQGHAQIAEKMVEFDLPPAIQEQIRLASQRLGVGEKIESPQENNGDKEFKLLGGIWICSPYCQFAGQVTSWGIDFATKVSVQQKDDLRFFPVDSPVYQAVFTKSEQQEYVVSVLSGAGKTQLFAYQSDQIRSDRASASIKLPVMNPYLLASVQLSNAQWNSSYDLNKDLSKPDYYSLGFEFGIIPKYLIKVWKYHLKTKMSFRFLTAKNRKTSDSSDTELKFDESVFGLRVYGLYFSKTFLPYFILESESQKYAIAEPTPRRFGMVAKNTFWGLGVMKDSYFFEVLSNLNTEIQDDQKYRVDPLKANIYKINIGYIYSYKIISMINGDICIGVSYRHEEQTARFDPYYLVSNGESRFNLTELDLSVGYRFRF